MAAHFISASLLRSAAAAPRDKPFVIRDSKLQGFVLRVQPSGKRTYYVRHGRSGITRLGSESELLPDEARLRAKQVLGNRAHGRAEMAGVAGAGEELGAFVDGEYKAHLEALHSRTAAATLERIDACFKSFWTRAMSGITAADLEAWRRKRLTTVKKATVVRDLEALAGAFTHAATLGHVSTNPVRALKALKLDKNKRIRFLSEAEERALRSALADRDTRMREARDRTNTWRAARHKPPLPVLSHYGDSLTVAVLISILTGARRGELLALIWADVDLPGRLVTFVGESEDGDTGTKTVQTRHNPLNPEAVAVLAAWREQTAAPATARVFADVKLGWKKPYAAILKSAGITRFRWHDLRHTFASRLVQRGVPLNTVRDLMGHESITTTLRYAHLAPDDKAAAVAKLV